MPRAEDRPARRTASTGMPEASQRCVSAGPRATRVIAAPHRLRGGEGGRGWDGRDRGRASKARARKRKTPMGPPLPLSPIELLAGLGPDVELLADDLPPGIASASPGGGPTPAVTTVAEAGKLLRAGDTTIRRLVRTRGVLAGSPIRSRAPPSRDRAGVLPRRRRTSPANRMPTRDFVSGRSRESLARSRLVPGSCRAGRSRRGIRGTDLESVRGCVRMSDSDATAVDGAAHCFVRRPALRRSRLCGGCCAPRFRMLVSTRG